MQLAYIHGYSTITTFMNLCSMLTDMIIAETAFMNLCSLLTHMVIAQKQHLWTYAVCLQTWSSHRNNIYEPMQSAHIHGHITETTFMNLCSLLTYKVIAQKQHLWAYAVCSHTWSYHRNNIYEPMQSAYIQGHSTETTFMDLCSLLTHMVIAQKQHLWTYAVCLHKWS